ncbi:hypothetical protein BJ170DRAFT_387040 [Xylariales sp. AK1849]|nr:hypothetical protein BJ170DRAFT_387040 [Xylariales sp. AK1849]
MDSPRPAVDLEKELTCSICTEVLYQPLTLLDCLHTFCGSCLQEWFSWQVTAAENLPDPPAPGAIIATCPSCRAPVRDTRHNATVATLLDMFLLANPDKARSEAEKEEMLLKYKPGDNVLPRIRMQEKSPEEQRLENLERQMLEQAREQSLREAGVESSGSSHRVRQQRREPQARRRDTSDRSDRESSRDSRHRDVGDRTRRTAREEERRPAPDANAMLQPGGSSEERRRGRSESQQRSRDSSRTRRRAIEHQASIRSLISASDVDSRDMEREIEEFARQIQEEGLLDGLDLDNIDLTRNDELSRKITEAYRRRQNQRSRHEPSRRSITSSHSHRSEIASAITRPPVTDTSRTTSRQRANSAQARPSSTSQVEDRSRPPVTSTHLEVRTGPERRRRRTSSGGRSATDPIRPSTADTQPAARSQTDLTIRSQGSDPNASRPSFGESRSSSMPTSGSGQPPMGLGLSFGERTSAAQISAPSAVGTSAESSSYERTRRRPKDLVVVPHSPLPSLGVPTSPSGHQRPRSHYYPEPSITCSRCSRPHIEYELHYNCSKCHAGNWNLCLECYRTGKGCLHWFGFGYAAFNKWERARASGNEQLEPPHMLHASRYTPPKYTPGGADGRRTMTTDDPMKRLQSGMFCVRCLAWANECYWRCDCCNEGDWGFCNNCVNQGRSCTHALLPLTYVPPASNSSTPPASPRTPNPPVSARLFTGPNAVSIGNFKPLTFTTTCDICRTAIAPSQSRYHCFTCTSTVIPDTEPGDYDICMDCYSNLVSEHHISPENGHAGWRRCLNGHRMVVIGFQDGNGGQRRYTVQDLVGGWDLHMDPYESSNPEERNSGLQKWWWTPGPSQSRPERLVTRDVAATAPTGGTWTDQFPPDGGVGLKSAAQWSWYPQVGSEDELLFPKGAEVSEVEDINGDWFFGCYMGAKGLFPAPYVRLKES